MALTTICYFSKSSKSAVAAEPDDKVLITLWLKAMYFVDEYQMDESISPQILVFQFFIIFSQLYSFAYLRSTVGKIECFGYFWQFLLCLEFQSQGNAMCLS